LKLATNLVTTTVTDHRSLSLPFPGLHKDYFKFRKIMEKRTREAELAAKDASKDAAEIAAMQE